ncbi:hypothetical protein [Mycobacterium sp.]|uniref:hypothetical protein n=1 Tax=Mycobacterium sp. TaxID=1785 RepID=UPI003F94EEF4
MERKFLDHMRELLASAPVLHADETPGRRARVRGTTKVAADFSLLAAAVNLARLGALGLRRATGQGWQVVPA